MCPKSCPILSLSLEIAHHYDYDCVLYSIVQNAMKFPTTCVTYTPAALCLTSACLLTYILRALFCEVARPRYNVHIYLQNDTSGTGMQMPRFLIGAHPRTQLLYWISPIYIPTFNRILPGRRRGRRRPHSVGWT